MAFVIQIKNKDFSAIKSAVVQKMTSVVNGLLSYHLLQDSLDTALVNQVTNATEATADGIPTFTGAHAVVGKGNALLFGTNPSASASRTWAVILKPSSTSGTTYPAGAIGSNAATNGAEYLMLTGPSISYEGVTFNPTTGAGSGNAATPAISLILDTYDLILVRIVTREKVEIMRPRTGEVKTVATTNSFAFLETAAN